MIGNIVFGILCMFFFYVEVEIGRVYLILRGKNVFFFIFFYRKMKLYINR